MGRNALIMICSNISRWAIRMIHLLLALTFLCVDIVILSVMPPRREKMEKPFSIWLPSTYLWPTQPMTWSLPTSLSPSLPAVTLTNATPLTLVFTVIQIHPTGPASRHRSCFCLCPESTYRTYFQGSSPFLLRSKDIPLKRPSLATLFKINPKPISFSRPLPCYILPHCFYFEYLFMCSISSTRQRNILPFLVLYPLISGRVPGTEEVPNNYLVNGWNHESV